MFVLISLLSQQTSTSDTIKGCNYHGYTNFLEKYLKIHISMDFLTHLPFFKGKKIDEALSANIEDKNVCPL